MKIQWLGHSAFLLTSKSGVRIITDPYEAGCYGGAIGYKKIDLEADIVTISHAHTDHNCTKEVLGSPQIINKAGNFDTKGIKIKGIPAFHDSVEGKQRGKIVIFTFEIDGLKVTHLGDLGHLLSAEQLAAIGKIDIVLTPIGGIAALDATKATKVSVDLGAKLVFPMHYDNDACTFGFDRLDPFLKGKSNTKKVNSSEIELSSLPDKQEVIILKHAR